MSDKFGKIAQVIGPVVDVSFDDASILPPIYTALKVDREDGTQFLHREFTKNDFSAHVDAGYLDNSALVGIVYDKIDGDNLTFAVSVGSPDKSSDDYVPLLIKIGRTGSVSVSKDTRLDTSSADEAADEVF